MAHMGMDVKNVGGWLSAEVVHGGWNQTHVCVCRPTVAGACVVVHAMRGCHTQSTDFEVTHLDLILMACAGVCLLT